MSVSSPRPSKILVVDDDAIIRDMMVDILEGYPITTARNGREALDKLTDGNTYLVFLDLMMPLMSGEEFCQHLNAKPELRVLHKIVLMSADSQLDYIQKLGVDAIMRKPFEFEDVMEMVEKYL